jgi:CRISPR-associated protein Csx17
MSDLVTHRLPGCNAGSLDAYLRGLGFFFLAGKVDPSVRAWWDEDGILNLGCRDFGALCEHIVRRLLDPRSPLAVLVRTPWRGKGRNEGFAELRNAAREAELDWFDACGVPRSLGQRGEEMSDKENNPLLGQGGGFGRSEMEKAERDALRKLRRLKLPDGGLSAVLAALVRDEPLDPAVWKKASVDNKVLGAYQSGRGTGPGLSAADVKATEQKARTNAWDIVLVLEGLCAFRGSPTRRAEAGAAVQAAFPLMVRARPIGVGPQLRKDEEGTFELLAPLWSGPCTARALRHLLAATRLRTNRGVARDSVDAVLVQAARAARGLGFDRLVRFAFVPGSDPRYRFAVRRGTIRARGQEAARRALEEVVPFLRQVERRVDPDREPASFKVARRRLEEALAALGVEHRGSTGGQLERGREAQGVLTALAAFQPPAARATRGSDPEVRAPYLSSAWLRLADDGSPEFRLARALVTGMTRGGTSLLRSTALPQREEDDRWFLDPDGPLPDLERVGEPVEALVRLVLLAARRAAPEEPLQRRGAARAADVALLLSGALDGDGERRLVLLAQALAGISLPERGEAPSADRREGIGASPEGPAAAGEARGSAVGDRRWVAVGADAARLILAAQPCEGEAGQSHAWLECATSLASLLLTGRYDGARVFADRELRRRRLDLLPAPPVGAPPPGSGPRLALAVLLPFDERDRASLARMVCITPTELQEEASHDH